MYKRCTASDYGGAFYINVNSVLLLTYSRLNDNSAAYGGGALVLESAEANISDSSFTNHDAVTGGVLYSVGSSSFFTHCIVANNGLTTFQGGAFYLSVGSNCISQYTNYTTNKVTSVVHFSVVLIFISFCALFSHLCRLLLEASSRRL